MPRSGSGVYSLPSPASPAVAGTTIVAADRNTIDTDIASALTQSLAADGQTTVTANLPLAGFKLTGVGAATARTDAATLANVQDATGVYVATVGGTADAITLTPSPAITAYAAGQRFVFIASGANTGATTVNVNSVGSRSITKNGTTALVAGDIASSALVDIIYDGTRFQLAQFYTLPTAPQVTTLEVGHATDTTLSRVSAGIIAVEGNQIFANGQTSLELGHASDTTLTRASAGIIAVEGVSLGYLQVPRSTTATTLAIGDVGKCVAITAAINIPASVFAAGDALSIYNDSAGSLNITISAGTLRLAGTTTTGTRVLAPRGLASLWFNVGGATPDVICTGAGVS